MKLPLTHTNPRGLALAAALPLLLAALAALPPFLGEGAREALMVAFAQACHQIPGRSFAVGGVPFALCHRCSGVVLGLALGALLWPLLRRAGGGAALVLVVAFLPMVLDWGLDVAGLWANTPLSRVATGLWGGGGLGFLMADALARPPRAQHPPGEVIEVS